MHFKLVAFAIPRASIYVGTLKITQMDFPGLRNVKASCYLASDINAINVANYVSDYPTTENVNDNDKEIQCDLLTEDEGHAIDPTRLSYKDRIRWHLKEFCYKTSSHGIPMLGQAPNISYRFGLSLT